MFNINKLQDFKLFAFLTIFQIKTCLTLVYTEHSAIGCFVAIAVPLNIPHHNAFVSYNFATAYGLSKDSEIFLSEKYPEYAIKEEADQNYSKIERGTLIASELSRSSSQNGESIIETRPLVTKRAFYQMIQDKLKMSGLKGEPCLLKLICEINSSMIGRYNGVLGTILHILISPSSSASENLPKKFYKAESNGAMGDCLIYDKSCPYSILDIFSVTIEDLLNTQFSKTLNKQI